MTGVVTVAGCVLVVNEPCLKVYRCANGYGASVIAGPYSRALDLVMVEFYDVDDRFGYELVGNDELFGEHHTMIGSDDDLVFALDKISELDRKKKEKNYEQN